MVRQNHCCQSMESERETVVVVVKTGMNPRRASQVLRWVRCLLPAALLVTSGTALPATESDDVITIDADTVASGPLSVADALARDRDRRMR